MLNIDNNFGNVVLPFAGIQVLFQNFTRPWTLGKRTRTEHRLRNEDRSF